MNRTARVVIIGGGIAGCSTLYHLVREGWSDVMLLERDALTSGTTWHSAAQVTSFGTNQTMIGLKSRSIDLYRQLARNDDHPVDYNYGDGGIRLAGNMVQMDGYHHFASMARSMGVELEVIDAAECIRRHPLLVADGLLGGLWDPHDGHVDPSQLCHALVNAARKAGAVIEKNCPVTGLHRKRTGGDWIVETPGGRIACESVVIAAGYRCNEVASMIDICLPVTSMEHQYVITEPMQEVEQARERIPLVRCPMDDFYLRQEKSGLLVGFYEQECKTWGTEGIDPGFTRALCPDDLDRITPTFEKAIGRVPSLATAGIRSVINGPITYTADGLPLVGRIPARTNAYCIAGLRAGIGEGGGHGWLLAQMIVHGEASLDTWCLDPARFGRYADAGFTNARAIEDYRNEFRFHLPHERRLAGSDARTTGLTRLHRNDGAFLEQINGWERVSVYPGNPGYRPPESFRKSSLHDLIRSEVLHVQDHVGMAEISGFNRIRISGSDACRWLEWLSPGRIPRSCGKTGLCYFLNHHGNLKCEAIIARLGDCYWYISAAAAEIHDMDWLHHHRAGNIRLDSLTGDYQTIVVSGPFARQVMTTVFGQSCSVRNLPWLSSTTASDETVIFNLSYTGEQAFEIHVPANRLRPTWERICEAGVMWNIKPFGQYAIDSMRLEKGLGHWKAEWITEYGPAECGIDRFINLNRDFVGRDAYLKTRSIGPRRTLCLLNLHPDHAHAWPGATIHSRNGPAGTVTSGNFGFRTGTNLALGYIDTDCLPGCQAFSVDILGQRVTATLLAEPPYDPAWSRVRD